MNRTALLSTLLVAALACSTAPAAWADQPEASPNAVTGPLNAQDMAELDKAIAGPWRSPANTARDKYRHPKQTLAFFGVKANQSVIEITPGTGWYTEILAPYLKAHGHYFGILFAPESVKPDARDETEDRNNQFEVKLARNPDQYVLTQVRKVDPQLPVLGPTASADVVLTFRNVHNWVMDGSQDAMFKAMFSVLKPGGVLGVVDHRAKPGPATDGKMGYLTEEQVIGYATAAGFVLDGKSEVNANPKDTKDHPEGVWTLPPVLRLKDKDREKYLAIGESDRMTLRFVKN